MQAEKAVASQAEKVILKEVGAAAHIEGSLVQQAEQGAGRVLDKGKGRATDSAGVEVGKRPTDFVVNKKGEAIPIPDGAQGPVPPKRGTGMSYEGGSGGKGMSDRVEGVRIMDPNKAQGRRVNYMNKNGQTVDPKKGGTISNSDPRGHLPYGE